MMIAYYIWLSNLKSIQLMEKKELLKKFITPENIYAASILDFPKEYQTRENFVNEIERRNLEQSEEILKENANNNIKTITIDNPFYRGSSRAEASSPLVLYYKGELSMEAKPTVAVVGTRKATEYGKVVAQLIWREYVDNNSIILSGLAAGIDSLAHQACLDAGGITYAFVANGLDTCYPAQNLKLMETIEKNGAVISPYPAGTLPKPHHFINRNKILAGWADEIVVVEAGAKSGALMTADFGKKFNRKIYAVPNNIFESSSIGCNQLILKGAIPYICKEGNLNSQLKKQKAKVKVAPIAEILKAIPLSVADLALKLSDTPENLNKELFLLELEGQVGFKPDGKWHYTGWRLGKSAISKSC
ncbi:MAG: DNA-protecting protein DprA, partial [Peptostreptococcaceae bacterium]|nr:DNA-protecting protein DprA [Peptostreptococcaceae bacterium]